MNERYGQTRFHELDLGLRWVSDGNPILRSTPGDTQMHVPLVLRPADPTTQ